MVDFLDEVKSDVEAAKELPKEEGLSHLGELATDLINTEDAIAELEDSLAELKRHKRLLGEVQIPELMNDMGLDEIKLSSGFKVKVSPVFTGKITEDNADEAFAWLKEEGHAGIVKGQLIVEYRLDNADDIAQIAQLADNLEYAHREKLAVHHMTLSAFLKDQITSGNEVPRDLLGVWTGFKTKIGR